MSAKSISTISLLSGICLAAAITVPTSAQSQTTTPAPAAPTQAEIAALAALEPEISSEIQAQIAQASSKFVNGVSLQPKIASNSATAAPAASLGVNFFHAAYCYAFSGSQVYTVVVFTDGTYVYTTNSGLFSVLASACPISSLVAVDVTATIGNNFSWDVFYVFHN